MLTQDMAARVQREVWKLWEILARRGSGNVIADLDLLCFLVFARWFEHAGSASPPNHESLLSQQLPARLLWSQIITSDYPGDVHKHFVELAEFINRHGSHSHPYTTAFDQFPGVLARVEPTFLISITQALESTNLGSAYEREEQQALLDGLIAKLWQSGQAGSYYSPPDVLNGMAALAAPQIRESVCDPAVGTASGLVAAYRYMNQPAEAGPFFTGFDIDATVIRIAAVNLLINGIVWPILLLKDSLQFAGWGSINNQKFDVVLCCPPFGNFHVNKYDRKEWQRIPTNRAEVAFVQLALNILRPGGRCVLHVPESLLFGSSNEALRLRQYLLEDNQVRAVISLPSGYLRPYTAIKTSLLYISKGLGGRDQPEPDEEVFFYRVQVPPGSRVPGPDVLRQAADAYRDFERSREKAPGAGAANSGGAGENVTWCRASLARIRENDYDLSAERYFPIAVSESPMRPPSEILSELIATQNALTENLRRLSELLHDIG